VTLLAWFTPVNNDSSLEGPKSRILQSRTRKIVLSEPRKEMKSVITASSRKHQKCLMLWLSVLKLIASTWTIHNKYQKDNGVSHYDIFNKITFYVACVKQAFEYQKRFVTTHLIVIAKKISLSTNFLVPRISFLRDGNPGDKWSRANVLAATDTDGVDFWFCSFGDVTPEFCLG